MQPTGPSPISRAAFTLIELLVVISIIVILAGLLFPAMSGVRDRANKLQASNDEQAIVGAVKAYFTEYGVYPSPTDLPAGSDAIFGSSSGLTNDRLFNVLRGLPTNPKGENTGTAYSLNARQIVFIEVKQAKDTTNPKNGISAVSSTAANSSKGQWMDPWGQPYVIFVDTDYNNHIGVAPFKSVYNACDDTEDTNGIITPGTKAPTPQVGVAVASFGKDLAPGVKTSGSGSSSVGDGNYSKSNCDDVVSWR